MTWVDSEFPVAVAIEPGELAIATALFVAASLLIAAVVYVCRRAST